MYAFVFSTRCLPVICITREHYCIRVAGVQIKDMHLSCLSLFGRLAYLRLVDSVGLIAQLYTCTCLVSYIT